MHRAGPALNRTLVLFAGLAACSSGCFTARPSGPDWFYHHAARNLTEAPVANCDERTFIKHVRKRADQALAETCPNPSRAYADGFREGFVDYVEAGGTGEPPYLPPFRYRLTSYRTDGGIATAEDWYAGFRHGSATARGSGLRELNYVPLPGPPVLASARTHDVAPVPFVPPAALPPPRPTVPAMPPPVRPSALPVPGVGKAPAPPAPLAVPTAWAPAPLAKPVAAKPAGETRPKPVVLVEHTEAPVPPPGFSPWQRAPEPREPRPPTVTRDP